MPWLSVVAGMPWLSCYCVHALALLLESQGMPWLYTVEGTPWLYCCELGHLD